MTATSQRGRQGPADAFDPVGGAPAPSGWAGWVVFAGALLLIVACLQFMQGLIALFHDDYYVVTRSGLAVDVDYTAWGVAHLVLGLLAVLVGLGMLAGNIVARVAGVALAVLSAVANMAFLAAYPIWSTIVIAIDIAVIYAITAHGGELKSAS
jgi:hypothetical protein